MEPLVVAVEVAQGGRHREAGLKQRYPPELLGDGADLVGDGLVLRRLPCRVGAGDVVGITAHPTGPCVEERLRIPVDHGIDL